MVQSPGVRSVRESLLAQARATTPDPIALEALRADVRACVAMIRMSMDRAFDFSARGLVSEAAAVVVDFPDLARQANALMDLPRGDALVERLWREQIDIDDQPLALPTSDEVDRLAMLVTQGERLRAPIDALRLSALRGEPLGSRLQLLRKVREADPRNRMWLDQIALLEREWLKRMGELVSRDADAVELEDAIAALGQREWVAGVPAGLKESLLAKAKPLRAERAAVRYASLADEIHRAAGLMDRAELERLEAEWAAGYHDTGRMPDDALQASVAPAFEWLTAEAAEEAARADFEARVDELDRALDQRRPWTEIDRMLAALRDEGRDAPEGTVRRALEWIAAERERERRRHRLVLTGALSAAAVVAVAGVVAIRAWSRATEARDSATRLMARIEAGDAPGARSIAEELLARPDLGTPEVAAALAREEELQRTWQAERSEVASASAALLAELEKQGVPRARLVQVAAELQLLKPRARLSAEQTALARLELLHGQRLGEVDAEDRAAADAALDAQKKLLDKWRTPERWTDAEQVDAARWRSYLDALSDGRGGLERTLADVSGFASQESRLQLAIDGMKQLEDEARARLVALQASLAALAASSIGAPVSSESMFVERIRSALADHGATLQRLGLLAAYERSGDCAQAWLSVQAWRDEVRPRLEASLGPALASPPPADVRDQIVAVVQEYLGKYPDSPYRVRVDQLSRRIDPGARARIWDSAELGDNLGDTRYAGLEEVPLRNGGLFYRRPSTLDTDPMHRVVDSLAELGEDPDSLGGILLPKEALAGAVRSCDVSDAWRDAERLIATAPVEEIPPIMLRLLQRLKTGNEGDSLFRIRAMRDATDIFLRCGHAPASVVAPLREWMDWVRKNADQVVLVDWTRAALDPNDQALALRRKAVEALQRFPSVEAVARQAEADQRRVGSELAPMAPVGVLLPADSAAARRFEGISGDGALVVIVRDGAGWRAADITIADGALATQGLEIPQGPVLVFRRSGS